MPSSLTCPDDAELLAVASGDELSPGQRGHLADCSRCRERLERFHAGVGLLRPAASQAGPAASTASGPACDLGNANGQADDSDATAPWPAAESPETKTSGP
jgi:hypothetical protein